MHKDHDRGHQALLTRPPRIKSLGILFILFCAYTALPVLEIPLINLSLSAPLFGIIALQLLFKVGFRSFPGLGQVLGVAWLIFFGLVISAFANAFFSQGNKFEMRDILATVRYSYWIFVYALSAYFLARKPETGIKIVGAISVTIFILGLIRWYEGIAFGKIGAWTEPKLMTQNSYALLFSTYAPFLFVFILDKKKKLYALLALLVVLSAVVINGSRSSWIAISVSLAASGVLYIMAKPTELKAIVRVILISLVLTAAALVFWKVAPESVKTSFEKRFSTMGSLEVDKSYQLRKILQKKAEIIFDENPFFGCGPGRFTKTQVYLEMPKILRAVSLDKLNTMNSHNSYMELLAETGLAGVIPVAILYLFLAVKGFKAALFFVRERQFWPLGIYVSFLSMSVHMWVISAFTNTAAWLKFGMVAGIILIARRVHLEKMRMKMHERSKAPNA